MLNAGHYLTAGRDLFGFLKHPLPSLFKGMAALFIYLVNR